MVTTIGIDPHKATHTAVAIDRSEMVLAEITVRADRHQTKKLVDWASGLDGDGRWTVDWCDPVLGETLPVGLEIVNRKS